MERQIYKCEYDHINFKGTTGLVLLRGTIYHNIRILYQADTKVNTSADGLLHFIVHVQNDADHVLWAVATGSRHIGLGLATFCAALVSSSAVCYTLWRSSSKPRPDDASR